MKDGQILVTNTEGAEWKRLDRDRQLTSDPAEIDPELAELLANDVAPTDPHAAELVASRGFNEPDKQRPLIKLLGCRLQKQVEAKKVTLRAETIERLRKSTCADSVVKSRHRGKRKLRVQSILRAAPRASAKAT